MPSVSPQVLQWARETAGLTLADAAAKLGFRDGRKGSAEERIIAFERGDANPTRPQLLKLAHAYRRPLLTFYLEVPPPRADRGEDFRHLPQRDEAADALVDALVRDIRARQELVRGAMEDEEAPPLSFVGAAKIDDGLTAVSSTLIEAITWDIDAYRRQRTSEAAFDYLRELAEGVGVFVLLIGNLGTHHTNISVERFRGFALADPIAPFIIINDQDAKTAWAFTLLHELVHVLLGASGLSGQRAEQGLERFCNDVASSILLPGDELPAHLADGSAEEVVAALAEFAASRKISRSLVAYRLFRAGELSLPLWERVNEIIREEFVRNRQARRDQANPGAPDYYVVRKHRLGPALVRFVRRSVEEGGLSPTRAGKILGLKARNVEHLFARVG